MLHPEDSLVEIKVKLNIAPQKWMKAILMKILHKLNVF
jgi:hypothetical protein